MKIFLRLLLRGERGRTSLMFWAIGILMRYLPGGSIFSDTATKESMMQSKRQLDSLEHVIFANFSHRPAIELAEKIVEITPQGLNKVFFADNGSSAVEIALKLSFQYHLQTGSCEKKKFVALSDAYHGETLELGSSGLTCTVKSTSL